MARILFDVHLNSSVSRPADNDLTYCSTESGAAISTKRGAAFNAKRDAIICAPAISRANREFTVFCRVTAIWQERDCRARGWRGRAFTHARTLRHPPRNQVGLRNSRTG